MPSTDVEKAARGAGISWSTVRRAKTALRIESRHVGQPGSDDEHWEWILPVEVAHHGLEDAEGAQASVLGVFGDREHLRPDQATRHDHDAPAASGAFCAECGDGPFVSQDWYAVHWDAFHEWPASVTEVQ
jgi:hypothetical protein